MLGPVAVLSGLLVVGRTFISYWIEEIFSVFLISMLLTACTTLAPEETPMNGRILLWHDWQGAEIQVLHELIAEFTKLHPGVEVIS